MTGIDIAVNAIDNASKIIENVGNTSEKVAQSLEKNWLKVTLAASATGIAIEAMARKQASLTEQTRKVAASLGMQEREVRKLALGLSDVSTPLEEVLDLMELGRQQGLKSAEQLKEYVNFWDMVGDASGEASKVLAEAGISLRVVGLAAGEEGKALAAFGYIAQETTSEVSEFLRFLQMTGPELRAMGATINDAAAILGILEQEFGLAGRRGISEFRQAVNESGGDLDRMLSLLGISKEMFDEYSRAVENSSGVIERNAKIHEESFTVMQKLQHWASELVYKYGDLLTVLSTLTPILATIGPLIKIITVAKELWALATAKVTTAIAGCTSPLLVASGAIAAMLAVCLAVTTAFDKLSDVIENRFLKAIFEALSPIQTMIELFGRLREAINLSRSGIGNLWETWKLTEEGVSKTFGGSGNVGISFGAGGRWQYGGTVPGPIGKPRLAIVHGGEEISNPYMGGSASETQSPYTIQNIFQIAELIVREEADIYRIAEQLLTLQKHKLAGVGVK